MNIITYKSHRCSEQCPAVFPLTVKELQSVKPGPRPSDSCCCVVLLTLCCLGRPTRVQHTRHGRGHECKYLMMLHLILRTIRSRRENIYLQSVVTPAGSTMILLSCTLLPFINSLFSIFLSLMKKNPSPCRFVRNPTG